MSDFVYVPNGEAEDYVELARTKSGRIFRKHLLNKGTLLHPETGEQIAVDDTFVATLKQNFDSGVCDIVQIPLANDKNQHSEDPDRNIGEVIGLEEKDNKVYAVMDIRDAGRAEKVGKTLLGASAMLHLDYTDTKTGNKVGPTLLHTAVTNRPYVTGLEPFEEIVAATDKAGDAVMLRLADSKPAESLPAQRPAAEETTVMPDDTTTQETPPAEPTLDELLATLKDKHGIDVSALQAQAAQTTATASLSKTIVDALSTAGIVQLSNTEPEKVSNDDIVGAIKELADKTVSLTSQVGSLQREGAERDVNALIQEGRVLPSQKPALVELRLTNPTMFDQLVPKEPIVKLDDEKGTTPTDDATHQQDIDAQVAALAAKHADMFAATAK